MAEQDASVLHRLAEQNRHFEAGYRGEQGSYPDWVYHARQDRVHREQNIPWLNDLLAALEWQGGTIHDALNCVRRLVEEESKRREGHPGKMRCLSCEYNWPPGTATRWHSSDLIEACEVCGGTQMVACPHERLNEEGVCRSCGADCRGIGS